MDTPGFTENELKAQLLIDVKNVMHYLTGKPVDGMDENTNLTTGLDLMDTEIQALYLPFEVVAKRYNPQAGRISSSECSDCETLGDCVDLIFSKI